jgi:uncharacterized Zn finger protein
MWWNSRPYVSAAQRRAKAARKLTQLAKQGRKTSPIQIAGRKIANTFWGQAWCDNLEGYSDFSNRLPRGRSYVRNGSVVDLQIKPGRITAMVSGSDMYDIHIELTPVAGQVWKEIKSRCAGRIGSLVDLLQGKLTEDVMGIVTARQGGLFPAPKEIKMRCSCPDYAHLCKHLAAVLYGIGARLDQQPELLFLLRQVDHLELITAAGERAAAPKLPSRKKAIADSALSEIFGIELDQSASGLTEASAAAVASPKPTPKRRSKRSPVAAPQQARSSTPGTPAKKRAVRPRAAKKSKAPTEAEPSKRRTRGKAASSAAKPKSKSRAKARGRSKP